MDRLAFGRVGVRLVVVGRGVRSRVVSAGAADGDWAEQIKRYVVSLRPAGAPIGRFVRVVFALLAVRRPRRAVLGGSKLDRARSLK